MTGFLMMLTTMAAAVVLGGMVFFAAGVAPTVFRTLDGDAAALLIRAIFPLYYTLMAAASAVGAIAAIMVRPLDAAVLGVVALGFLVARVALVPAANRFRDREQDGDAAAGRAFARLHRLSVAVNLTQMVVVALVLARIGLAAA